MPAGSWAHGTIIKPVGPHDEFDADLLVRLEPVDGLLPKDYIELLYTHFNTSGTYSGKVSRKTRCLRVNYAGDFHVDLVPFLDTDTGTVITNRHEPSGHGRFEASYPDKFNEWIDEQQRHTSQNFCPSMQLLKYLRDYKNTFQCKSVILSALAGRTVDHVAIALDSAKYQDVASTFVTLLEDLASSLPPTMPDVFDPAGTGDNFTSRYASDWDYKNFRQRIAGYAVKAREALDEPDAVRSVDLWRGIFGDRFPAQETNLSSSPTSLTVQAPNEQYIDEPPFSFPFELDHKVSASIAGLVEGLNLGDRTMRKGFRKFQLSKYGNRVPKSRSIQFTVTTNAAAPYEVYWKVRNGGPEAANSLRGEITLDSGSRSKTEPTAYRGSHYVEAYVVKNGKVIARDRQNVVVLQRE